MGVAGSTWDGSGVPGTRPWHVPGTARLVVDARNTSWVPFVLERTLATHSRAAGAWYDSLLTSPSAAQQYRTAVARELRTQLALIETNVGVLSEAFGDILPVLDQHEAAGPHIRVARLDYPFFRDRVPVMLQDIGEGLARIAGIIRDLPAPLPEAPQAPAPPVGGH